MKLDSQQQPIFFVTLLCFILASGRFALDSYLPSLPAISHYFSMGPEASQLTISLYLIGFSVSQLIYGPLSDHFGRRNILLFGYCLFVISSLACSFVNSIQALIILRFFAGFGVGAGIVTVRAIARDCFSQKDLIRVSTHITTAITVVLLIAPVIGGFVEESYGWRGNFLLMSLMAIFATLLIFTLLPETNRQKNLVPIFFRTTLDDYFQLLSDRQFTALILSNALSFTGMVAYFQISPYIFENAMGFSPKQYGFLSLYLALGFIIGGYFTNKLAKNNSIKTNMYIGFGFLIFSGLLFVSFAYVQFQTSFSILLPTIINFIGQRIIMANTTAGALTPYPKKSGKAAALMGSTLMGASFLVSIFDVYFHILGMMGLAMIYLVIALVSLAIFHQGIRHTKVFTS